MKNITKKQMITLIVLVCVLILVIAVQYFYRPLLEKKEELVKKVDSMSAVYSDMQMLAAVYSIDNISYKEAKEELQKQRSELREVMSESAEDKFLTDMLVNYHISVESSEISALTKEKVRVECAVDKENEDSVDGYSAISMYPKGGKVISDDDEYVSLEYATGECSREIYYNISGTYSDMIAFIQHAQEIKGLEISRFYFNSGDMNNNTDTAAQAAAAVTEAEKTDNAEGETTEETKAVEKADIIKDSVYKAGIGLRLHMYDRNFDLVSGEGL
jgi:cell division protein FtsL